MSDALILSSREWKSIQSEVDEVIELSLLGGSPDIAMNYGYRMIRDGRIKGVKLAKLFYELGEIWSSFNTDDRVEDTVEKEMGVPKDTFLKYSRMYKYVLLDRPQLAGKPIEGLLKLTAAARDEELGDKEWKDIEKAHDARSMIAIRNRVRDIHTSGSTRITITWSRDGYVRARRGDEFRDLGFLVRPTGDELTDKSVESIITARGIVEI